MNNCDSNTEYRCRNGQCIDKQLYLDDREDYMDFSDSLTFTPNNLCGLLRTFAICQDCPCPPLMFSCGDGYCYDGPTIIEQKPSCVNRRDRLYLKQMPPSTIILFSHIHLIYNNTIPEWICYNETLCPYLETKPLTIHTNTFNNLTCQTFRSFSNQTYTNFKEMIQHVKQLTMSCSLLPRDQQSDTCPLFECNDRSKCISYHRVLDGHQDCAYGEDEYQLDTCSYNLTHRLPCDNRTKCIPMWFLLDRKVSP